MEGRSVTGRVRVNCARALIALALGSSLAQAASPAVPIAVDVDWSKAAPVTVVMTEYRFSPSQLLFHRGVAYRLHLDNRGYELHEFTAPAFFKAIVLRNPEALKAEGREVVLRPGEQTDLYFVAEQPGRYGLTCADHDWTGMVGGIIVD